jgi:hypothetical protein
LSVEGQKFGAHALRDCNVQCVLGAQRQIQPSQKSCRSSYVHAGYQSGVVVRAIRASNVENAMRASSAVMSCIRTLRAIAGANSAAAE